MFDFHEIQPGTILVGAGGCQARVKRIKRHNDRPDEIILESLVYVDVDGLPVELNGRYTEADFRTGRVRVRSPRLGQPGCKEGVSDE